MVYEQWQLTVLEKLPIHIANYPLRQLAGKAHSNGSSFGQRSASKHVCIHELLIKK